MKKKSYIIVFIVVLVLVVGVCFCISVINSPEYALKQMAKDIEESGVDGLMPHLTGEAQETVSTITTITENEFVNSLLSLLGKDDYASVLKSNLKDVEWSVSDILKGKEKTDVFLDFNYDDKLSGTIEINMMRVDGEWKISGIEMPTFE